MYKINAKKLFITGRLFTQADTFLHCVSLEFACKPAFGDIWWPRGSGGHGGLVVMGAGAHGGLVAMGVWWSWGLVPTGVWWPGG